MARPGADCQPVATARQKIDPALLALQLRGRGGTCWHGAVSRCSSRASTSIWRWRSASRAAAGRLASCGCRIPPGSPSIAARGVVHVASTRNPNQVFDLEPVTGVLPRWTTTPRRSGGRPLVPRARALLLPGSLYLHDLALIGGDSARQFGRAERRRPPSRRRQVRAGLVAALHRDEIGPPVFEHNYLQLNSIAAGARWQTSFFSASTDRPSARRPGHRNFPVDKRGVVFFAGATREPIARGLDAPAFRPPARRPNLGR